MAVKALHQQGSAKQNDDRQKAGCHRLEVELLNPHLAQGAKQQGWREQQKNQISQVFNGHRPYPADATCHETCSNQHRDRGKGHKDKRIHAAILACTTRPPTLH
jgi:hypothetical protein